MLLLHASGDSRCLSAGSHDMWARLSRLSRTLILPRHCHCLVFAPRLLGFEHSFHSQRTFSSAKMAAATAASTASNSTIYFPDPYDHHHLLDKAKLLCADLIIASLPSAFPAANSTVLTAARADIAGRMSKAGQKGRGELALPCFIFNKKMDPAFTLPPPAVAPLLAQHITTRLAADTNVAVEKVEAAGPYVNFYLTSGYLASVVPVILDKTFLAPLPRVKQQRVMIEYSQVSRTHTPLTAGLPAALNDGRSQLTVLLCVFADVCSAQHSQSLSRRSHSQRFAGRLPRPPVRTDGPSSGGSQLLR